MGEVDPFKHPPVYKEDQVITKEDLTLLAQAYVWAEKMMRLSGRHADADNCCLAHLTCERLKEWLEKGKPEPIKEEDVDEYFK